jgi:hypothetical protein
LSTTTILNAMGDTTIAWTSDRDDEMAAIIEKKMKEGVSFFIIEDEGARRKLEAETAEAIKAETSARRRIAIPDEDFLRFVQTGAGVEMKTPAVRRGRPRLNGLGEHWAATGWRLRDGRVIEARCHLPAGTWGEVRLRRRGEWGWRIKGDFNDRVSTHGPYRTLRAAAKACETALRARLLQAIRIIGR